MEKITNSERLTKMNSQIKCLAKYVSIKMKEKIANHTRFELLEDIGNMRFVLNLASLTKNGSKDQIKTTLK